MMIQMVVNRVVIYKWLYELLGLIGCVSNMDMTIFIYFERHTQACIQ